jgi:putative ATPase
MDAVAAFRLLGPPEGELALAQAAVYLATAPKSNRIYRAYGKVRTTIDRTGSLPVPLHIRNAPTALMKSMGYGKGYQYDPDTEAGVAHQTYLPAEIGGERFYEPVDRGYEKIIRERMEWWRKMKK